LYLSEKKEKKSRKEKSAKVGGDAGAYAEVNVSGQAGDIHIHQKGSVDKSGSERFHEVPPETPLEFLFLHLGRFLLRFMSPRRLQTALTILVLLPIADIAYFLHSILPGPSGSISLNSGGELWFGVSIVAVGILAPFLALSFSRKCSTCGAYFSMRSVNRKVSTPYTYQGKTYYETKETRVCANCGARDHLSSVEEDTSN
jgi:hypothetical protein